MILLLGGSGYVGSAFRSFLDERSLRYRNVSRSELDYAQPGVLAKCLRETKPEFLINCAGYTGKPNVDACELHKAECLAGNAVLPGLIREACELSDVPWGHVSSGCIYTGDRPGGGGFREDDAPNFCFRTDNCSFYSGTKALGEECLEGSQNAFVWRLRVPFNHIDSGRNYLSKLMRYDCLLDATNSISHLNEFVRCCWECWENRVPFGTYNVTNGGAVTAREIVEIIKKHGIVDKEYKFFESEDQFMRLAAKTPRSNCVMDNSKLLATGISISEVHDAIESSLSNWQTEA
jgi:dTDP-4-dehydrorhamnose reductase